MKIRITFFFIILGCGNLISAQIPKWNWAFKSGGNRDESILKSFSDKEGNAYFLINSQSNPIFLGSTSTPANPPVNGNVNTSILQKINSQGELVWSVKNPPSNCSFNNCFGDDYGFIYLSGQYFGTFNFQGRTITNNTIFNRSFFAKLSSQTGQVVWVRDSEITFSSLLFSQKCFYIDITSFNADTIDQVVLERKGFYLAKMDTSCRLIAVKSLGGIQPNGNPTLSITGFTKAGQGDISVVGSYNASTPYDSTSWILPLIDNPLKQESFLSIWDTSFQLRKIFVTKSFANVFTTNNPQCQIKFSKSDNQGFIIVGGQFYADSLLFDSVSIAGMTSVPNAGKDNIFLAKFDANGNILWARSFFSQNQDLLNGLYVDNFDNIYFSGLTGNFCQFDDFQGLGFFITKTTKTGKVSWVKGANSINCYPGQLSGDDKGNLYCTGGFAKTNSVPPTTTMVLDSIQIPWTTPAAGLQNQVDLFLARLGNCNLANPSLSGPSTQSFCQGDSLTLNCSSFQKYQWSTGDSTQNISIKKPGAYHCYIYDSLGCYARSQTIAVKEIPVRTYSLSASICSGESYFGYDTSGVYIDTLVSSLGCDSIRTLTLSIKPKITFSQNIRLCHNQTLQVGTRIYTQVGIYRDTLIAANGCDSIITSTLNYDIPNNSIQLSTDFGALAAPSQDGYQWLDCNAGFIPISGETDSSFSPTLSGSYSVKVTKGNCSDTSSCLFITSSSKSIAASSELEIFPNPNTGKATVRWKAGKPGDRLLVSSLEGKIVLRLELNADRKASIQHLPAGVYVVKPEKDGPRPVRVMVE